MMVAISTVKKILTNKSQSVAKARLKSSRQLPVVVPSNSIASTTPSTTASAEATPFSEKSPCTIADPHQVASCLEEQQQKRQNRCKHGIVSSPAAPILAVVEMLDELVVHHSEQALYRPVSVDRSFVGALIEEESTAMFVDR